MKKLGPLGLRLVEGLRGQAFRLAQQVDLATLASEKGAETLLRTLNDNLKPRKAQEARELYAAGSREGGLLSRQSGEPMSSYVSRRRAWWSALQGLDSNLKIPDMILAEQILTNCGLTDDQKLMIRTVLQGTFSVDKVCEELLSQHPNIHDRERGRGHGFGKSGKGGKPWRKNPWKPGFSRGYHAEAEWTEDEWDTSSQSLTGYTAAYETEYEYQDEELYGYEAQHHEGWSDENDEDFLVMSFAMLSDGGLDLQSDEACAYAAECLQLEHEAYLVRNKGKGKGFNGFGQKREFDITGSVSFQERKARLAQLKAKTECRRCGQKGHWSGDAACPKGATRGSSTSPSKRGSFGSRPPSTSASSGKGKAAKPRVVYFSMANHQDEQGNGEAYMALHGNENMSSIYDGACVPPPTSLQMTSPTSSSTEAAGMAPASVPTSWLSSMMGLPPLTAPTASGFASTSLSATTGSGLAPTSLTAPTGSGSATTSLTASTASGLAMAAMEKKKEDEDRARELHEFARQQLQVALREEGENVEYDVDWELIRRATESPFRPGDLSLTTAFQTLGWREVDDGVRNQPPLPIQDAPSTSPHPKSSSTPQSLHPRLPPNATPEEVRKAALRAYPTGLDEPETPVMTVSNATTWNSAERIKYLDWYLEHMKPHDHPDYVDAYAERWSEFVPGHFLFGEDDRINMERWKKKAAAGQPVLPEALRPAEKNKSAPPSLTSTTTCPHRHTTRKGTNKYYEMETCLDCHQLLRREKKGQRSEVKPPMMRDLDSKLCQHARWTWKGSNGHSWRQSCLDCGKVVTGRHGQAGGLHGVHAGEKPSNMKYSISQVQALFHMCEVVAKVKVMEDPHQSLSMDQLHRILDAVAVGYAQESSMNELEHQKGKGKGKRERQAYMSLGDEECEGEAVSENHLFVLLDSGCNKTCHGECWLQRYQRAVGVGDFHMSEDTGGNFNGIGGKISTNGIRHLDVSFELEDGGLAVGDLNSVELAESDAPLLLSVADQRKLGLVLELEENRDRVYSRTLKAYLKVDRFNGLVGIRLLPSDLLGLSQDRGLRDPDTSPGIEVTSPGFEVAPSGFEAMEQDPCRESALDLGPPVLDQNSNENYLSIEDVPRKTLTRGQKKALDQGRKGVIESDISMWSTLSGDRRLTPLPKGCKVFLMEIFAGAAVLTSMALSMQLPVATPVDLNLDGTNLLDPKVRAQIDEEIDRLDPYLLTFAPVCSPWGAWSRLNMAKNEETAMQILEERDAWYPCLCWIRRVAKRRLAKGRKILVENPWGSELWSTICFRKLIEEAPDAESGELLEVVRADQCAYGLRDHWTNELHMKPTGFMTASKPIKERLQLRCTGDHIHQPLEGSDRTKRASQWPEALCEAMILGALEDLQHRTVHAAFYDASQEEEPYEEYNFGSLDAVIDKADEGSAVAVIPEKHDQHELERQETTSPYDWPWKQLGHATTSENRRCFDRIL